MKKLAASIACAIGFATPGFCSDLGESDIANRSNTKSIYSFTADCAGPFDTNKSECSVDFTADTMSVNGSTGISPNQIVSVYDNWYPYKYYVGVQYTSPKGDPSLAQFSFNEKSTAKEFLGTVFQFMGGNLQPELGSAEAAVDSDASTEEAAPASSIDTFETSCTGPSILCFGGDLQPEVESSKPVVESDSPTEEEASATDPIVNTPETSCTGPTILCFD